MPMTIRCRLIGRARWLSRLARREGLWSGRALLRIAPVFGFFEAKEGGFTQLKAHPLPWLVEILNGVEHANFFEQRATEYSKAASRGSWDGEDGVWATFGRI
ncbi:MULTISPECIES: hypothetical protein [unclassified Bradyrhizobium]|uniref:hypothetical protein n=1 Tax=unclassified Bradyrhizobium TaxID=2631580 RepID=UPI00211E6511|nr:MULTISPECIES: hypothetical protein [unclassified Bradyrhizobium]